MITVKATREGLIGGKTATGYVIDRIVPFVALPSWRALHRFVRVRNPLNGKQTLAIVLDVGPWNEADDRYVFQPVTVAPLSPAVQDLPIVRPAAESGKDTRGRTTNHAAIDLSEAVWEALGMKDNTTVHWEFAD